MDGETAEEDGDASRQCYIRTVQDELSFVMERKRTVTQQEHHCLYRHEESRLTLFLPVRQSTCVEEPIDLNEYMSRISSYKQVVRDYIYCRANGMRIAVDRHFDDYVDPDVYQMDYDCFNRYKFECYVHVELETNDPHALHHFRRALCADDVVHRLFTVMANKNLNGVSDEIINIENMALVHKYGYENPAKPRIRSMQYYSLKYDGVRENFCIFGRFIQVGRRCFQFDQHFFGQVVVGHCELLASGELILIDVYIVSENFSRIAKKYNISYTGAMQNYHQFYATSVSNTAAPKTQDEYFHMKRLTSNIKFLTPLQAIEILQLLRQHIWPAEDALSRSVGLQKFYRSFDGLCREASRCTLKIDGFLGYRAHKIYKLKRELTIDLVLRFDEMFRSVYKRMKTSSQELKKMIEYVSIQRTLNWLEFERKYPGKFDKFAAEFLYFAHGKSLLKHYPDWGVYFDLELFYEQLRRSHSTLFVLLLEFEMHFEAKTLIFRRLREDKFSANGVKVFANILKQF